MGLKNLIYNNANEEAQKILKEAELEKEKLLNKLNEETDKKINNLLNNANALNNKKLSEKRLLFEHEKKRVILEEKNTQIERVLSMFKEKLTNLNDEELFEYTLKIIKKEKLTGEETLRVKKEDYNRYLKLFSSSNKKAKLVTLDLLNERLGKGYNLKLEDEHANINDGFILIGKYYDLNFSLEPELESIRRKYEREIHKILYE